MDVLLDKEEDSDQDLYADSAYRSEAIEMACIKKGIKSCNHEKGYRGRLLTKRQQQRNRKKSKQVHGLNTSSPVWLTVWTSCICVTGASEETQPAVADESNV